MTRRLLLLVVTLAAAFLQPSPTSAQLAGVVTDTAGVPLEGVVVEAWDDRSRIAARATDGDGRFVFPEDVARRADRLRTGRLGYEPLERSVDDPDDEIVLRLRAEAVPVRGVVVRSERSLCDRDEDPRARRLWERMRRRYRGPMDTVGIATYLARAEAMVSRDEIGPLELPSRMIEQRGSSSQLRFSWSRRVRRSGYAFPVRRTVRGQSFDSWSYAPLEADFAPHFVDELFGSLHRFHLRDQGDFGWIVEFCPRDDDDPAIRGSMRLGPDTSLVSVNWLFRTPEPHEDAGGRARFPPVGPPSATNVPLPTESIVWRRHPSGSFREVHRRFERWIVAPGDTVPFLPSREP